MNTLTQGIMVGDMPKEPKDARSTYRRRARAILLKLVEKGEREYCCATCGYIPSIPWNQPSRSGDILDANHRNKILADLDPANLEFLCRVCHLKHDRATEKGVSPIEDTYGYDLEIYE